MSSERHIVGHLAGGEQRLGLAVVNAVWGHVADARVPVHRAVPVEEGLAVRSRILDAAEACREVGPILHRLELCLRGRRPAKSYTARINGHEPYAYNKDVLERLPNKPNRRIDELLPHRWTPAS